MSLSYGEFIKRKSAPGVSDGFEPLWIPDFLFPFQSSLVGFAIRKGRSAILADCGMGKTPMQLVWGHNVVMKTNKPVLLLTPLAVGPQTFREAAKFGIDAERSQEGWSGSAKIIITNYERLQHFDSGMFGGLICDESSILKNFDGATKKAVTDFAAGVDYRLLCTATAAPNDFHELGTSSEALGYLGYQDMLSRFFKQETRTDHYGFNRSKYRFRGHAEHPFWRWVCSWARACRKPSDLGFDDDGFILPKLTESEHVVENSTPRNGMLFSTPAKGLREQREERRITLIERCEAVADLVEKHKKEEPDHPHSVVWCHLNAEGDLLEKLIPGCIQVSGSMSDEEKEGRLSAFQSGNSQVLVTKPKIGCYGLNWQHCNHVVTFPSHSWEQYYQAVRRCWRFGQSREVFVNIITTQGEVGVMNNLQRKAEQAEKMFDSLVMHMANEMEISRTTTYSLEEELPTWLLQTS